MQRFGPAAGGPVVDNGDMHHAGNWDDYRFVLALCREGSISGAARALGVDDTTVARRLAQAERALGARLFERERGRVTMTEAASVAMDRLTAIDDGFHGLRDALSGADHRVAGTVSVTAVPIVANHALRPRLAEILAAHPALEIELLVDSALLGITPRRDADIALRGTRPSSDPDAITRKLGEMSYGVYCRADRVARGPGPRPDSGSGSGSGSDTDGDESRDGLGWIAWSSRRGGVGRPQARWIDERIAAGEGTARARVNDGETLLQCVLGGLGKSLLADAVACRFPALARLEHDACPIPTRELWMLMHPSCREVRRIDVVASWLAEVVRDFLAAPSALAVSRTDEASRAGGPRPPP